MIPPSDILLPERLSRHAKLHALGQITAALQRLEGTPKEKVTPVIPVDNGCKTWRLAPSGSAGHMKWIATLDASSRIDLPIDFERDSALVFVMGRTITTYTRIRVTVMGRIDLAAYTLLLTWLRGKSEGVHPHFLGASNPRSGRLKLRSVQHATPELVGLFPHDESRQIALDEMLIQASAATGITLA